MSFSVTLPAVAPALRVGEAWMAAESFGCEEHQIWAEPTEAQIKRHCQNWD